MSYAIEYVLRHSDTHRACQKLSSRRKTFAFLMNELSTATAQSNTEMQQCKPFSLELVNIVPITMQKKKKRRGLPSDNAAAVLAEKSYTKTPLVLIRNAGTHGSSLVWLRSPVR